MIGDTSRSKFVAMAMMMMSLFSLVVATRASNNITNVIIMLADNLGYTDVGIFGREYASDTEKSRTPSLDNAALEGRRLLNWNSPAVLCSASRAALLTGECRIV